MGNPGRWFWAGLLAAVAALPCCASTRGATGADSALIEARMESEEALADLLSVPRPGRIETDADGAAWLALGVEGPRLLPWGGVPAGLQCAALPEEGGRTWQLRGPEAVVLRFDAENMTLWAVDHEQECVVSWEPMPPSEPMGDPVVALSVHVSYSMDGPSDPPEVSSEQDLVPSPGRETLYLTSDTFVITAEDGAVLFSYTIDDPEPYGGSRDIDLAVEREPSGRLLFKLEVETLEDMEETSGSHTRKEVLTWSGAEGAVPVVVSSLREWTSDDAPLGCGESVTEEGEETETRARVPAGILLHEATRSSSESSTEVCVDGESLCSVTTGESSLSWSWTLEYGDGELIELGANELDTSFGESTCGQ